MAYLTPWVAISWGVVWENEPAIRPAAMMSRPVHFRAFARRGQILYAGKRASPSMYMMPCIYQYSVVLWVNVRELAVAVVPIAAIPFEFTENDLWVV
jgi:hypothetical protein